MMRKECTKILFTILISICCFACFAQNQYATTSNGKKVVLKSDGTWEYLQTKTNNISKQRNTSNSAYSRSNSKSSKNRYSRTYIRGPRGGCYYINSNGNKTYVDRSLCQ